MTDVRTSHAEDLLYGPYAPFVKLMGQAAVSLTLLGNELGGALTESHKADSISRDGADPDENRFQDWDARLRSPQTQWLEGVYEEMFQLVEQVVRANRKLAADCIVRWTETRDTIHSMQALTGNDANSGSKPEPGVAHPQRP